VVEEKLERAAELERKEKCCERETERGREEESSRERERRTSQKPPLMVAVVSGAGGAWWLRENNDLGHGGLGPSREIRDERGREATG
jgi:hypothetical protein